MRADFVVAEPFLAKDPGIAIGRGVVIRRRHECSRVRGRPSLVEMRRHLLQVILITAVVAEKNDVPKTVYGKTVGRDSSNFSKTSSGMVIVPGNRIWDVGGA